MRESQRVKCVECIFYDPLSQEELHSTLMRDIVGICTFEDNDMPISAPKCPRVCDVFSRDDKRKWSDIS